MTRAERDNDLIYHHEIPPVTSLPPIVEASLVQSSIPPQLTEPKAAVGDAVIFGELLGYGTKVALGTSAFTQLSGSGVASHKLTRECHRYLQEPQANLDSGSNH